MYLFQVGGEGGDRRGVSVILYSISVSTVECSLSKMSKMAREGIEPFTPIERVEVRPCRLLFTALCKETVPCVVVWNAPTLRSYPVLTRTRTREKDEALPSSPSIAISSNRY